MSVQFAAGKAEMRVNNLALDDYHFLGNAIGPNFDNPATQDDAVVSFDVVWSGPITRRLTVTDGTLGNNYAGNYVENQATVTWTGTNLATGFSFTSDPGTFATSFFDGGFAEIGKEQNGIFFDALATAGSATSVAVVALPATAWPPSPTPAGQLAAQQRVAAITAFTSGSSQATHLAPSVVELPSGPAHAAVAARAAVVDQLFAGLGRDPFADAV